jgi:hypothetical protein
MNQNAMPSIWKAQDGIVNPELFEAQEIKILWILREPNGENFDFMKYLRDPTVYKRWKASYGLVVKLSYAIFNNLQNHASIPNPSKNVKEIMPKIALINIKKTGGKSTINPKKITKSASEEQDQIANQIIEINPDVIIFGGTKKYLSNQTLDKIRECIKKPVKIISNYHPNQKKITHKEYLDRALASFHSN